MLKDKEVKENKEIKPFEKGQKVIIYNMEREIIDIDIDNNILVEVQIIDNQGNNKTVKQWYTMVSAELI